MNSGNGQQDSSTSRNMFIQLMPRRIQHTVHHLGSMLWNGRRNVDVFGGPVTADFCTQAQASKLPMRKVRPDEYFFTREKANKNTWQQKWFRVEIPAPEAGETGRRALHWDCRGESVVYLDGKPWASLDVAHPFCFIPEKRCTLWIDCGTYQTGLFYSGSKSPDQFGLRFEGAWISRINEKAWEVYWDFEVMLQLMAKLLEQHNLRISYGFAYHQKIESTPPLLRKLINRLHQACDAYEASGLDALRPALKRAYAEFPSENWQVNATLAGHAHIDYVWLWPERVTKRKTVHTFATMAHLMEYYPEFRFTSSSPALYKAVAESEPDLARKIKKLIRQKRWEATGATWVELDTHMPCGEALARSFSHGQHYFADLRGKPSKLLWLPDVFGYTASLPQLMRLGGVEYFSTTKLTWSHVNRFPFTSFIWRGNDGSEVLAHVVPGSYNGENPMDDLTHLSKAHVQSGIHPEVLSPVGIGDGGGGTTIKALELSRRVRNLSQIPTAKWGFMEDFCVRMDKVRQSLPVYDGELYLEIHRGTYTTQSQYKLAYRNVEKALQAYEAVRVALAKGPIDKAPWNRLECAQFHDAIPGSSIGLVYQELGGELRKLAPDLLSKAKAELEDSKTDRTFVFNPFAVSRKAVVSVPASSISKQRPVLGQRIGHGELLVHAELKGLQGLAVDSCATAAVKPDWSVSPRTLFNGIVRADFDRQGRLKRLTVDEQPIRMKAPCGFMLYHDRPADCDAWDIDQYSTYLGSPTAQHMNLAVIEKGPVRAILRGQSKLSDKSSLVLDYILEYGSPWLKVEAKIDWHEDHKLLKFHFPTDYRGKETRYGCPFGSVLRPQLPGSPEAEAMWEVPAARWAALSDEDGAPGLAVITEAKYGFSCRAGNLGLSLLKAPKSPDPEADIGNHVIRFAVGLHQMRSAGDRLNTAAVAETLYTPLLVLNRKQPIEPMVEFGDMGSLVPSWVLPSETGRGFILRMHETMGGHGKTVITLAKAFKSAELVDFLERPIGKPKVLGSRRIRIDYEPHKVISLRIRP